MKQENYSFNEIFAPTGHLSDEQISAYINRTLPADDIRTIELHLADCDFCANALEAWQEIGDANMDQMAARLDAKINAFINDESTQTSPDESAKVIEFSPADTRKTIVESAPASNPMRKYYSIAATMLLVVVVGFGIFRLNQNGNAGALPDIEVPSYIITRGGESTDLSQAGVLFNEGKYGEAASIFGKVNDPKAIYYAGLASLKNEQPAEAIAKFKQLVEKGGSYSEQAQWYLARAYYDNGQVDNATALYKDIKDKPEGDFSQQATEMLKLLEKAN